MEIQEFIEKFEETSKVIKNSINLKGTYRLISEKDWSKLKKDALAHYLVEDDIEFGYGGEDALD